MRALGAMVPRCHSGAMSVLVSSSVLVPVSWIHHICEMSVGSGLPVLGCLARGTLQEQTDRGGREEV